jgi:hypothetical protein
MATVVQIFDRTKIVDTINNVCLKDEGTSGVLLASHKVGKTKLLEHVYSSSGSHQGNIFCRINLDMLRAEAQSNRLSNQVFLKFFLSQLAQQIEEWVERQVPDEEDCKARLNQANQQLDALPTPANPAAQTPEENARHDSLIRNRQAFMLRLHELEKPRKLLDSIRDILAKAEPARRRAPIHIRVSQVFAILDKLQRLTKRVVLFIDDYHLMVKELGFTEDLFLFLRAANQDRKIILLVSSYLHLMDESLHRGTQNRRALFNHFRTVELRPFNMDEPDLFLDWPSAINPPLKPEQKAYLRELGGGSPFFLELGRDQFLESNRPEPGARRDEFERELATIFKSGFIDIWERCDAAKRSALHSVATGGTVAASTKTIQDLVSDGYLVEDGGKLRLFSKLFSQFLTERPLDKPADEIAVNTDVLYTVFPTALSYAVPKVPLITIRAENRTNGKVTVRYWCKLVGYSNEWPVTLDLPAQDVQIKDVSLTLLDPAVKGLTELKRTQLNYTVQFPGEEKKDYAEQIFVYPVDYFTFARRSKESKKLLDYTWLIAAWVHRDEPRLEPIRSRALRAHGLGGYPEEGPNVAGEVRAQVGALYDALKKEHPNLAYDNSTLAFHQAKENYTQRVRTPGRVLKEGAANCVEGSALFASLLLKSDLQPIILLTPGHAIVGWKDQDTNDANLEFLETTVIQNQPFNEALELGKKWADDYEKLWKLWQQTSPEDPKELREIPDSEDFAIPVDIVQAIEARELIALPYSNE